MVFTCHYLIAAEQADEKVRKVRGMLTVEHLRISWDKTTTPYLNALGKMLRPRLSRYGPRAIRIPRPKDSTYKDPVDAWLYFDGPLSELTRHSKMVLDMPGGGFVAMSPRHHEDKLLTWAGKTGLPALSLDYKKAPEYPYPYALNECYDVYRTLVATKGRCIGLAGSVMPKVIFTGDSAGGNFATGVMLMILQAAGNDGQTWQASREYLPVPEGLILIYPNLDMNIGSWMSDDQMALIQDQRTRKTNRNVMRRKSEDYHKLAQTPHASDDELLEDEDDSKVANIKTDPPLSPPTAQEGAIAATTSNGHPSTPKPKVLKTRLAMSSMISYFNDRVLTPEMMRAMVILYVGPHNRPDFSTDYLLSPLLAPEPLLARFPKTFFMTGERDPLVDDTVIFAGRIRQAKHNDFVQRKELGLLPSRDKFDEKDHVEVTLIPGISHGFLQFVSIFPEAWKHLHRCCLWMEDIFDACELDLATSRTPTSATSHQPESARSAGARQSERHHHRVPTESSGDEDNPLMMSTSKDAENSMKGSRRGRGKRVRHAGREEGRSKSLVSLGSETDLMARRMKGLAGGLMGMAEGDGATTP